MSFATKVHRLVEQNFSSVVVGAVLLGLIVPGIDLLPTAGISLSLSLIIFLACFGISAENLRGISILQCTKFYMARFILLPLLLWIFARICLPSFATAILLFALMPAGVSAPAVASLFGGNVGMALGLVVVSSLLCPIVTPLFFFLCEGTEVQYDYMGIFFSLALVVLLPLILHLPLRRSSRMKGWIQTNSRFLSTVLIGVVMILVVGGSRAAIFANSSELLDTLLVTIFGFFVFYLFGWYMGRGLDREGRIATTFSSGVNNNALGIGIAAIHFEPRVALFLVVSEFPWIAAIALFGKFLRKRSEECH